MKKILFAVILLTTTVAFAENTVNVKPFAITTDNAKAGCTGTMTVVLENETPAASVAFSLYVPTGMKITAASSSGSRGSLTVQIPEMKTTSAAGYSGYYKFTPYSVTNLTGTSGEILTLTYTITSDMAEGVYPIRFSSASIVDADATSEPSLMSSFSYVVVGNGGSLTFPSAYYLPSFVMDELNKDSKVTKLDISKIKGIYGTYALVDGRTIVAPEGGLKVDKATYTRTVTGYGSLELPFEVTEGGTFYTTKVTAAPADGGYVHFDADTKLAANTAAIIKDETVNVSTTNFTITSVAPKTITTGYYVKSAGIYQVNGSAVINPYRASWDFGSAVKGFTFGDDATGISTVELDENGSIYDLNGRKLNKAGRGVNIINGQKILKK